MKQFYGGYAPHLNYKPALINELIHAFTMF